MRPTRRRSRCSECSLILNETRCQGERGRRAACCARGARLDQRRSLEPCAPRRARPALGGRRSADRRSRPARPDLDIAARQSLREPVAYGISAAGALAGAFVRRGARGPRCGRGGRSRPQVAAGDQMAERSGADRGQVRRHPDRRREQRGRRSASASIARAIPPAWSIPRPISPPPVRAVSPAALFGALSVKMIGRVAQWNGGEGFSTIRADWLARAAGFGDDDPRTSCRSRADRALRGDRPGRQPGAALARRQDHDDRGRRRASCCRRRPPARRVDRNP